MKYVFFGTAEFAAAILKKLMDAGMPPLAVVCNPDKPVGRKQIITSPPVKVIAEAGKIKVLQPNKLVLSELSPQLPLSPWKFDFFLVAAYGKIIPESVLNMPRLGTVGVHPSILPRFRGASPIQSSILYGEKETGVTLFLVDKEIDHGNIIATSGKIPVNGENYESLSEKLSELAGGFTAEFLPKFLKGEIVLTPQNEYEATFTRKFKSKDGYIAETDLKTAVSGSNPETVKDIDNKIRALNPEPGTYTMINEKRIKLLSAEIKDGKLVLTLIQPEGKKPILPSQYKISLS